MSAIAGAAAAVLVQMPLVMENGETDMAEVQASRITDESPSETAIVKAHQHAAHRQGAGLAA